jgi:hypothetical protein
MSNMLALTESGNMSPIGPREGLYIVGSAISDVAIQNLPSHSETRAKQTAELTEIKNFKGHALKVGGLEAYEMLADAKDAKTGTAMLLYQVIAPDEGGYFIIQGLVSADRAAVVLPEFRQVTETFRKLEEARRPTPQ